MSLDGSDDDDILPLDTISYKYKFAKGRCKITEYVPFIDTYGCVFLCNFSDIRYYCWRVIQTVCLYGGGPLRF